MIARSAAIAVCFAALLPELAHAQERAVEQPGPELRQLLGRFADRWLHGDAAGLANLAGTGLVLVLRGDSPPVGPLGQRQAAAMLRRLFEERETLSVTGTDIRLAGGSPVHAFGELVWVSKARGTTVPERLVLYLEFRFLEDAWRVTQIRVMP